MTIFRSVVLPDPLVPRIARHSPGATSRLTPRERLVAVGIRLADVAPGDGGFTLGLGHRRVCPSELALRDGHKWMLGPEGLGFFYCRRELIERMRPEIGWMNVIDARGLREVRLHIARGCGGFECGSYNIPGVLALGAALDLLLEVGIDAVWSRVQFLTALLIDSLPAKGYRILSPRGDGESSGIVAFSAPDARHHPAITPILRKPANYHCSTRRKAPPSPHFYQNESAFTNSWMRCHHIDTCQYL